MFKIISKKDFENNPNLYEYKKENQDINLDHGDLNSIKSSKKIYSIRVSSKIDNSIFYFEEKIVECIKELNKSENISGLLLSFEVNDTASILPNLAEIMGNIEDTLENILSNNMYLMFCTTSLKEVNQDTITLECFIGCDTPIEENHDTSYIILLPDQES